MKEVLRSADESRALGALPRVWELQDQFTDDEFAEEPLHDRLQERAPHYATLLEAIRAYERFCRGLHDAFEIMRAEAGSHDARGLDVPTLARNEDFAAAVRNLGDRCDRARHRLGEVDLLMANQFDDRFGTFGDWMTPADCALAICDHHERVQRGKSATGKRPWFDRLAPKRIYMRHRYRESRRPPVEPERYVHDYRGRPIRRFYFARFLEIEAEPNREDLAFLLEREAKLGGVYAGVLVDHSQAGVEHSLRWDVLPVRIHRGVQHAKLSLLAWSERVRVIVASANLTESGYRYNREVSIAIDASPRDAQREHVREACAFLRRLLGFVPGATPEQATIRRATAFVDQVERQVGTWKRRRDADATVQQRLIFSLPKQPENPATGEPAAPARSPLREVMRRCRSAGGAPEEAWVASPFYDPGDREDPATSALCRAMDSAAARHLTICVPVIGDGTETPLRLAAPPSLLHTGDRRGVETAFEILPPREEQQVRPWHAKMIALRSAAYEALLIGSSNFTTAGMGVGQRRNAEANVLTLAVRRRFARAPNDLVDLWPEMDVIDDAAAAEWLGPQEEEEAEGTGGALLPAGFLTVTYRAGDRRALVLRFCPDRLPKRWALLAAQPGTISREPLKLLDQQAWRRDRDPVDLTLGWPSPQPPEKLLVRWETVEGDQAEAFWPINVEDARALPPPADLERMTADDMLAVLGAADPSAAFRAWARRQQSSEAGYEDEFDSAMPADLDPLRLHDLSATFLHRVRRRARVLAAVRANLERPAWGEQAVQWRLRGLIGIEPLARRLMRDVAEADGQVDEALLSLADLLIVLREVEYRSTSGALPKRAFDAIYEPFLHELVADLDTHVQPHRGWLGEDVVAFWDRVIERCRS